MTQPTVPLLEIFRLAGWDVTEDPPTAEEVAHVNELCRLAQLSPNKIVAELIKAERATRDSTRAAGRARSAAEDIGAVLKKLLAASPILCPLERFEREGRQGAHAICHVAGQLRRLPVHPDVRFKDLEALEPWEYACVHPQEMVVVGTLRGGDLFSRAQGEVVDYKGHQDPSQGLVRVARHAQDEFIVRLAPSLRKRTLKPPLKLVLHRGNPGLAIATVRNEQPESRFEVEIDRIHTRLEDLAGMDPIIEPLIKDIVLRLLRPEIRTTFDLRPLEGILIYSYKPGMGKTSLMRGLSRWLHELGEKEGFEFALYHVKPNELKSLWHGGDARLVREDLCGSIRARQEMKRTRPLFQMIVLDEIDSLGKRAGGDDLTASYSPAQNDAVQALLSEMDGMLQKAPESDNAPSFVLWAGLTNRPDLLDEGLKRGGRFADLVVEVPAATLESAEGILSVHARSDSLPWFLNGEIRTGLSEEAVRQHFLRPALQRVFPAVVLKYTSDGQPSVDVSAGEILAGVHYRDAMNEAKRRAADRRLMEEGVPAITCDDVLAGLIGQCHSAARQMEADRQMLRRQMRLVSMVSSVAPVPEAELSALEFLDHSSD